MSYTNIQSHIDSIRRRTQDFTFDEDLFNDRMREALDRAIEDVRREHAQNFTELNNELELLEAAIQKEKKE